jgi:hypothetical protein
VGTDGSGGGSTTSTSTSPTSSSASASTTSTGGGGLCDQHCASEKAKGCPLADCVTSCQHGEGPTGQCAMQQQALFACEDKPTTDCHNHSNDCYAEELSYANCLRLASPCTGALNCFGSMTPGDCTCDVGCGADTLGSHCAATNGVVECDCLKNGAVVGHCTETPQSSSSCEYFDGCCAVVAFPSP